ncbi:LicD family protein [Psychrobacillus sp. L3]|uniref:LicD family protein n=1 Tax=Psychrobacillus sp. L3 TaxID=3236891 RepID=UPI0036F38A79
MKKPNVIVFGASKAGQNFLKNQDEYHVLAIADNDSNKHNNYLDNIPIISPNQMSNYQYEYIIIASMFIEGITKQLLEDLSIDKEKIVYVPKRLLKIEDREIFGHFETKKLAHRYLELLGEFFQKNEYKCFLNFGTLLGIVRDGDLIPWDDDIDLAVIKDFDEEQFLVNLKEVCKQSGIEVEYLIKNKPELGLVGLDILVSSPNTYSFTISVDLLIEDGEHYCLPIDIVPKKYFKKQQKLQLGNIELFGPSPVEEYLTYVYRDWKVVKKDVTYENNTTTYNEPENLVLHKEV